MLPHLETSPDSSELVLAAQGIPTKASTQRAAHYPKESITMDDNESARERRLRRRYKKAGLRLEKTPGRHWTRAYYGPGYQIVENNTVIWGCGGREYEGSLTGAEEMFSVFVPDAS